MSFEYFLKYKEVSPLGGITWNDVNTFRTGDADLRFYVTTVQDG